MRSITIFNARKKVIKDPILTYNLRSALNRDTNINEKSKIRLTINSCPSSRPKLNEKRGPIRLSSCPKRLFK
jgi:hypothetical protein